MRLITKQTDYAIRILGSMAGGSDAVHTTTELAEKLKISKPFVRAIMQKLNKERIIFSTKGKGGGFRMATEPDQISIVSLINIFQGPVKLDDCLIRKSVCPEVKTCPLKKKLQDIGCYINEEFKDLTLDKILK
ncbi:MAG: Rrf2 family transcriptional regulator [Actinobacteria bacterium]|nr:Rrf2 family transcriptional regulator [Actinomycetota bacterium]